MSLKDSLERQFYMEMCRIEHWDKLQPMNNLCKEILLWKHISLSYPKEKKYNSMLLQSNNLDVLDVYVSEFAEQDGNYYLISGQEDKKEILNLIKNAASNNQIEFASGFTMSEFGTYFTFSVDKRTNDKKDDIKLYRVFVPYLFKSSVQEVLLYIQQHQKSDIN